MIRLEAVRRRYSDFELSVDFEVGEGEIVALLGSSGSGKSTTLRIIAGFESIDSGRLMVDGRDLTALPARRRGIGFVFQDYTLFPHLNVAQNVGYGLRAARIPRVQRERRVEELLTMVGLGQFGTRAVQTLSGGEQQRVAVARALALQPRALLLDEPFSAIDTELREGLRRSLVAVQRALRIPTVFVTHSRSEALAVADRIVILRDGRVVEVGAPEILYETPADAYTARFLGHANIFSVAELLRTPAVLEPEARVALEREVPERLVMIRPEHVEVGAAGLPAQLEHHTYHGMIRSYEFSCALGTVTTHSTVAVPDTQHLALRFPTARCVLLERAGD